MTDGQPQTSDRHLNGRKEQPCAERGAVLKNVIGLLLAAALVGSAGAAPVVGVTPSTTITTIGVSAPISQIYDGSGLSGGQVFSSTHAISGPTNAWLGQTSSLPGSILFTFPALTTIDGFMGL